MESDGVSRPYEEGFRATILPDMWRVPSKAGCGEIYEWELPQLG